MRALPPVWQAFAKFVLISGFGWLCDFVTYCLLTGFFGWSPFWANFVSSYVGVTFVWFASLRIVFREHDGPASSIYLPLYWLFQLFSILVYSRLLQWVAEGIEASGLIAAWSVPAAIAGKVIVTPINLGTNYIFMRFLMDKVGKKNANRA